MLSIRRTATLVALFLLALQGDLSAAQARGFRLRLGGIVHRVPSHPAAAPRHASVVAPTIALGRRAEAEPNPTTTGAVDPSAPVGQRPVTEPVARAAEPWCRSGRFAGSGEGFCLIN